MPTFKDILPIAKPARGSALRKQIALLPGTKRNATMGETKREDKRTLFSEFVNRESPNEENQNDVLLRTRRLDDNGYVVGEFWSLKLAPDTIVEAEYETIFRKEYTVTKPKTAAEQKAAKKTAKTAKTKRVAKQKAAKRERSKKPQSATAKSSETASKKTAKQSGSNAVNRYGIRLVKNGEPIPVSRMLHHLGFMEVETSIAKTVIESFDAMPSMGTFYWQLKLGRTGQKQPLSLSTNQLRVLNARIQHARKEASIV